MARVKKIASKVTTHTEPLVTESRRETRVSGRASPRPPLTPEPDDVRAAGLVEPEPHAATATTMIVPTAATAMIRLIRRRTTRLPFAATLSRESQICSGKSSRAQHPQCGRTGA